MATKEKKFEFKPEHLKLLQAMDFGSRTFEELDCPGIDSKKPFGDDEVPEAVAEILGWKFDPDNEQEQMDLAYKLLAETIDALHIILTHCQVEFGIYTRRDLGAKWGEDEVCTGYGKCHGSLSWCKYCRDTYYMCDEPDTCDVHSARRQEEDYLRGGKHHCGICGNTHNHCDCVATGRR